jgi:hypothetical protein
VIRTSTFARRGAAALIVAGCAAAVSVPAALGQATAEVSVNPSSGPPGSQFTITMKNYRACAADSPNCIVIDFVQSGTATRIGTADSKGQSSFSGNVSVPPAAKAGSATIHAHSTLDDASTGFTVTSGAATTTSTTTTSTSAVSTTSTTVAVTTTVSTVVLAPGTTTSTTAVPITTKKSSSHSDIPRYIAVALVVTAAAATAAVDTRLRRLRD